MKRILILVLCLGFNFLAHSLYAYPDFGSPEWQIMNVGIFNLFNLRG